MGVVSGIVVFIMVWWTVLFTTLPLWVHRHDGPPETGIQAAPDHPRLLRKFLLTTAVSLVIWLVIFALIETEIVSFHDLARQMDVQDRTIQ